MLQNLRIAGASSNAQDGMKMQANLRSDLLSLKEHVADRKEQDRPGDQPCQLRPDEHQTLTERQRRGHRPLELNQLNRQQRPERPHRRVQERQDRLGIESIRRQSCESKL
jgi:hypothetical protein